MSTTFTTAMTPRETATAAQRSAAGRCSVRKKSGGARSWRRQKRRLPDSSSQQKHRASPNDTIGVAESFSAPFSGISGSCKKISATAFRGCCGTGPRNRDADECADATTDRARLYLQRTSRHRQDDDCAYFGDGAELPECDWQCAATYGRALRGM